MRELLFDVRRNGVLILAKVGVLSALAVVCFHGLAFTASASTALHRGFSQEHEVEMYSITDTLTDPQAFFDARHSPATMRSVESFITALEATPDFRFLSAFDQPIPIADFPGDETFDAGYGTEMQTRGQYVDDAGTTKQDVKSMQMNRAAFQFFQLTVVEGESIPWEDVDYVEGRVPVLLGSEFRSLYSVGDQLEGDFYMEPFVLTVAGFLEPGSAMYYHGDMDTYLDTSVIVPYPADLAKVSARDPEFAAILAFAILGGDIAAPKGTSADDVIRTLGPIANESGFSDYTLLNAPMYLVQYGQIRELLQQNRGLVLGLATAVIAVALGIAALVSGAILARRRPAFAVRSLQGATPEQLGRSLAACIALEYAAIVVVTVTLTSVVPDRNSLQQLAVVAGLCLLATLDTFLQCRLLRRIPPHETEVS